MQDIGYSGQYLDDKEFRVKIRTGSDIQNTLSDAVAGEMLLVTGASPAIYVCTKTVAGQDPAEVYKIANLTDMVAEPNPLENVDSDNDGVSDAVDYWYFDELETYTKEDLDALELDNSNSSVAQWDIIKCIATPDSMFPDSEGIVAGEYYLAAELYGNIWHVWGQSSTDVNEDNSVRRAGLNDRGVVWQKVLR
jgi:hypothetical protein